MKKGTRVQITDKTRKGEIGTYTGDETTPIGVLCRVEFEGGQAGLYRKNYLRQVDKDGEPIVKTKKKKVPKPIKESAVKLRHLTVLKNMQENGGKVSTAMRDANYSPQYAKTPDRLVKTKSFQELIDELLPESLVEQTHRELMGAKRIEELVFNEDVADQDIGDLLATAGCVLKKCYVFKGQKHALFWSPDNRARKDAIDMAYKIRNRYKETIKLELDRYKKLSDAELSERLQAAKRFFTKK